MEQKIEFSVFFDVNGVACIGFTDEASGVWISDPRKSTCGRFEADPVKDYGLTKEQVVDLLALNDSVEEAVEAALHAGCAEIQALLQVTDGGFAGIYFSGPEHREVMAKIFADYGLSEYNHNKH
jgi:hypothetical protein